MSLPRWSQLFSIHKDIPIQRINDPVTEKAGVQLFVKRLDLIHPYMSGNKWFKLKYNLLHALEAGQTTLLSFGGAYSNHLYALAAAGQALGLHTVGVIRGEAPEVENETLLFLRGMGMKLIFVSREDYRRKREPGFILQLLVQTGEALVLPEGGSNALAVKGCREILCGEELSQFDHFAVSLGTGATLAGILLAVNGQKPVTAFCSLKGELTLIDEVKALMQSEGGFSDMGNCAIFQEYHFGGYARTTPELHTFVSSFPIPIEPVYTGKMFYGILDLIGKGYFQKGEKVLAIHTGGLRGSFLRSF